jgi:phosphatidate cytidylyltransferase
MFVFTVFIAFFAPFGGFFVSGLKRALKHKQLGLTLHKGGVIDRLDCAIILGFFMLVYVHGFIYRQDETKMEKAQKLVRQLST